MKHMMYPKLALSSIRKNAQMYVPYLLTCIFTVIMFSLMKSLSVNKSVMEISSSVSEVLSLGSGVLAVFSVIFLFYTNSFIMKKRRKEFGLFNILGMEKKHIALLNAYENLYCAGAGIIAGLIFSSLLEKLMYLVMAKIIGASTVPEYQFSASSLLSTAGFFAVLFFFIYLNSVRIIYRTKTIELLKSEHTGEREPKARWIIAVLGLVCLGAGYWMALSVNNAVAATVLFFIAVLLVIAGTFLLFTAGSIAFLKILKKNKGYYYKTNHFISVSGMIYRMKQNAAGLSNICILSTMVLVVISTTVSLLFGIESVVMTRCPSDFVITTDAPADGIENVISETVEDAGIKADDWQCCRTLSFMSVKDGNTYTAKFEENAESYTKMCILAAVTADDYNRIMGTDIHPGQSGVYAYSNRSNFTDSEISVGDIKFRVEGKLDEVIRNGAAEVNVAETLYLVVSDTETIDKLNEYQKNVYGRNASEISTCISFNTDISEEEQISLYDTVHKAAVSWLLETGTAEDRYVLVENRVETRNSAHELFGGLFFIGAFLGIMFASATVIIIYYKQISEGLDDRERFVIMQKVGMDRSEIRKSINSQVLTVFFLPLGLAGVHICFAFPMIRKILLLLGLTDTAVFIKSTAGCYIAFALVYAAVYMLTSKVYYRIVSAK